MLKHAFLLTVAMTSLAAPASAYQKAFLGWPSPHAFDPYRPYRDGMIAFPSAEGPVPVHVRIYSVPMMQPYYNVPPYIVLDP